MKDSCDRQTIDLFHFAHPIKRGRGRPVTGTAMTNAERQRVYREKVKLCNANKTVTVTKNHGDIDWKSRAVSLQLELDGLREQTRLMQQRAERQTREIEELRCSVRPFKAQATKYRNENQALRDKIQHLEFMASVGKS